MTTISFKPGETTPELEEIKKFCRTSLFFLCGQFLKYPDWDAVHDDMEKFLYRPSLRKALIIPRNHLKSTFVTISFTIQQIIKNPNIRVLIANGVWDLARKFLDEIKKQLEESQLKYLFGEFISARWNADEIIVKQRTKPLKEPTIMTTGVEAETTSGHYDLIILDDLMGLQNTQTPEQRAKVKKFRRSMFNLLEPDGMLIDLGTRWSLDDTFSEIFEKESKYYDVMVKKVVENGKLIFPRKFSRTFDPVRKNWTTTFAVKVTEKNGEEKVVEKIQAITQGQALTWAQNKYGKKAFVEFAGDPLCMDYVDHLKASMPLDEFSANYLNEPFSSENQLFKPENFKYWNQRPDGLYIGMAVDLAISEARYADETAIVVVGMDKDWKLFVLDYLKGRWKPSEVVGNVFDMRTKWKPHSVGMETNGFQRMLRSACEEEMRNRREYFPIEEIKTGPERIKTDRIKTLEPFYRNGTISHAAWMKGKAMEEELQTFPKGKHDDIIDALSMALPLLHPGVGGNRQQESEWDMWLKMARENDRKFEGFFEYGK